MCYETGTELILFILRRCAKSTHFLQRLESEILHRTICVMIIADVLVGAKPSANPIITPLWIRCHLVLDNSFRVIVMKHIIFEGTCVIIHHADVLLCIAFVFNNNDSHPSTQHPVSCNASICMNACTLPIHLRIITARYRILFALTGFSIWDWNDGATSFVPRLWHSCWDAWLKILANTGQSQLRHESVIHCATITMYWR